MKEDFLLSAMSGLDDDLLARSEKTVRTTQKLWKRVLPIAACMCLLIAVAAVAVKMIPEPMPSDTAPQSTAEETDWSVHYNESASVTSADRARIPGYFTEELSQQELHAVLPEKWHEWMKCTGISGFDGEGNLVNVQLQISTQLPDEQLEVVLGDDLACVVVKTDMVLSPCRELEYSVYQYTASEDVIKLEAITTIGDVPARFTMVVTQQQLEQAKQDFEAVLECFAWYEKGEPDMAAVTAETIPEWFDNQLTLEEAAQDAAFGQYMLTQLPDTFTAESIRRYKDQNHNYLSGLWTSNLDYLSWKVQAYTDADAARLTSVADKKNYDLSLYPIPRAESVPEELLEIVNSPVFLIEELTLDAVMARAYKVGDAGDSDGWRMQFSVKYGDKIVSISTKGVDPRWLYDQLKAL